MRLYFENPIGRLMEHPDGYALIKYNAGPRDFTSFQAFLIHTHQLLRRHGWHKLLADQRTMTPFTEQERHWIGNEWLARSTSDGYELFGAVIVPNKEITHHPVKLLFDKYVLKSPYTYQLFEAEEDATTWLHAVGS